MRHSQLYESIAGTYTTTRTADPRIAAQIDAGLATAETVVNVGAGTGNYEPTGRSVLAVEPSAEMIRRRPADGATVVRAAAEHLPISSGSFDAAMASLTLHHWADRAHGLRELRRVARRQVVFMFDPRLIYDFWA